MTDERSVRGPPDHQRINMSEDYEVAYWSKKWGVSRERLAEVVGKAGPIPCGLQAGNISGWEPQSVPLAVPCMTLDDR